MTIKVEPTHQKDGVDVPTMAEFNALADRVSRLESLVVNLQHRLGDVESGALKSGDTVSLINHSEFLTWMTSGGEVKSRGTAYIGDLQGWKIQRQ